MRLVRVLLFKITNLVKFSIEVFVAQLQSTPVQLHWGSHRKEFGLSKYIIDFVVEKSPDAFFSVQDPVIKSSENRHAFGDRAIYRLRNATFDPNTGYVFLGDLVVSESLADGPGTHIRKLNATRKIARRPVIGVPTQSHFHWLIETLPRIIAAVTFEPDALLVAPTNLSPVQRGALEMLGLEVQYSDARQYCDELILATRGRDTGWAHPHDVNLLRRTYDVPSEPGGERIFVSRSNSRRSDENSLKIDRFAASQGWTVVEAERLGWRDHLLVFGKAAIVGGEHGAGLTNIVLAPGRSQLLKLMRPDWANPCYAVLSLVINDGTDFYQSADLLDFELVLTTSGG